MAAPTPVDVNLNDTNPPASAGMQLVKWQASTPYDLQVNVNGVLVTVPFCDVSAQVPDVGSGTLIGFIINVGVTGVNVGPMLAAAHSGNISKCKVVVKASDPSVDLIFKIKKNGTDIFATDPTVTHGTSSGTVLTFTSLTSSPVSVAADDVFSIDITSGTTSWQFTAQME